MKRAWTAIFSLNCTLKTLSWTMSNNSKHSKKWQRVYGILFNAYTSRKKKNWSVINFSMKFTFIDIRLVLLFYIHIPSKETLLRKKLFIVSFIVNIGSSWISVSICINRSIGKSFRCHYLDFSGTRCSWAKIFTIEVTKGKKWRREE